MSFPPPLMMSQPGSFAHRTLTQRWPAIVRRVIAENSFTTAQVTALEVLLQDLAEGQVRELQDPTAPDLEDWQGYLKSFLGLPWIGLPWLFAEIYFYRRLLEATQYFQSGDWQRVDPFRQQKQASLQAALGDLQGLLADVRSPSSALVGDWQLLELLYGGLWGNRVDLSLHPTASVLALQHQVTEAAHDHILVDDSPILLDWLMQSPPTRIDLIADNAGFELICDLLLLDELLSQSVCQTAHLHLKNHPTFVSDATIVDLEETLTALAIAPPTAPLAERLWHYWNSDQLTVSADPFWTAPLVFWEMPSPLKQELGQADLVLIKGDANYRRLLGDRRWPMTAEFSAIVHYFPAPLVAIRSLKSEIVVGLTPEQLETLPQEDTEWLIDGQWGLIQSYGIKQASVEAHIDASAPVTNADLGNF